MGNLFASVCDGDGSVLHDLYALRTDPGSVRQVVHYDTPHQDVPPLFAAFIALQDVTEGMGGTVFLPGTHKATNKKRAQWDQSAFDDALRDDMLAKSKSSYALLGSGDLVVFDMRTLHAGAANLVGEGDTRLFLCLTFRNERTASAHGQDLGHVPCLRPGFRDRFTLGDLRRELSSDSPFSDVGNGLE